MKYCDCDQSVYAGVDKSDCCAVSLLTATLGSNHVPTKRFSFPGVKLMKRIGIRWSQWRSKGDRK